jgi:FkbM family methyltransferase
MLCHPAVGRMVATVMRDRIASAGCGVDTSSNAIRPEIKASLFWGLYERAEIGFVRRYLSPDCDVVELGSSLGVVSCNIRRILPRNCRLVCVEANPEVLPVLHSTLRLNACDHNMTIIAGAINYSGARDGIVSFSPGSSNVQGHIATAADGLDCINVPALTLSEVLSRADIGGPFALVSDIEGAEAGIVLNEHKALARCTQVVIELHRATVNRTDVQPRDMVDLFVRMHGFRLRDSRGSVCVFDR